MKNWKPSKIWTVEEINRRATSAPEEFVAEICGRYRTDVQNAADQLAAWDADCRLIMLAGPSSAGKTTTAGYLKKFLQEKGVNPHIISLDDFYRGRELAPLLPNGQYDYESLEALNLDQLQTCMQEILQKGVTRIPRFDFHTGRPAPETHELKIGSNSAVIFEGIHALNPIFEEHLGADSLRKIFINTISRVYDGEEKLLSRRHLRLIRRSFRDLQFRNSPLDNTFNMWPQVIRGEDIYMFPYVDGADVVIDTTHPFEPCMFAKEYLPYLEQAQVTAEHEATLAALRDALRRFVPLSENLLPADALLWEFVGKDS